MIEQIKDSSAVTIDPPRPVLATGEPEIFEAVGRSVQSPKRGSGKCG